VTREISEAHGHKADCTALVEEPDGFLFITAIKHDRCQSLCNLFMAKTVTILSANIGVCDIDRCHTHGEKNSEICHCEFKKMLL